jgi:hypothetical protein
MKICNRKNCNNPNNSKFKICEPCRRNNRERMGIKRNSQKYRIIDICRSDPDSKISKQIMEIIENER